MMHFKFSLQSEILCRNYFIIDTEPNNYFFQYFSLLNYTTNDIIINLLYYLEWPDMIDSVLSSSEQTTPSNDDKTRITTSSPSLTSLSNFDDETKTRILTLLKELGQNNNSSSQTDNLSTTKLAFIGKNLYVCSTCTGPVQWV